jgi:hypothetical protein
MKKVLSLLVAVVLFLIFSFTVIADEQRRGCCSWHGGVCGCSGGRALCCDDTLSPSCGCD